MALEYDVRPEYQSMSLDQLLETTVMCFEGVGDTQNDILNRYFGVTTVRQLANMPYFLWALGIQEMALKGGETSTKPIGEVASSESLKFSIVPHGQGKNAVELLNSAVNLLDGLTPAQNLAIYDAFRITNVVQLAHNRIMLEARVIEYLEKHPELVQSTEGADVSEIASILGVDTVIPTSGDQAQGVLSGDTAADGMRQMAGELNEHLRGRIDALKSRAAERARDISATSTMPSQEELTESVDSRRAATGAGASRSDALAAIRERTEATRVQTVAPAAASGRAAALASARGVAGTAASRTTAAPTGAPATPAAGAARDSSTTPSMTVRPPPTQAAQPGAAGAGAAATAAGAGTAGAGAAPTEAVERAPAATEREPAGFVFRPWMAGAGAAAVVLIALILWMIPGGEEAPEQQPVATADGDAQQAGAEQETAATPGETAAGAVETGTETTATAGETAAGATGTETAAVETRAVPQPQSGPPIRSIHSVREGESLWRISRQEYDHPLHWPTIYKANDDQIEDPDLIYPKQQFKIPDE